MKKLSIALTILPFLAAGPALAQNTLEDDFLTPHERALNRHPEINPDWTWMTEDQAALILKSAGYDLLLSIENGGSAWRGKAMRDHESYHVAVDRYCEVFDHLDKKSLSLRAVQAKRTEPTKMPESMLATLNGPVVAPISHMAPTNALTPGRTTATVMGEVATALAPGRPVATVMGVVMLATLNGPVATPISHMAPPALTPGRPVITPMGEVGWTWMTQDLAVRLLKAKGYANISSVNRDEHGIWRAKATKNDLAVHVGIDMYGNTEDQPEGHGGVAQASASD